jgi:hypothetical protein
VALLEGIHLQGRVQEYSTKIAKRDTKGVRRTFKGFELSILNWNRDKMSIDKLIYNVAATFQDQHQHFQTNA